MSQIDDKSLSIASVATAIEIYDTALHKLQEIISTKMLVGLDYSIENAMSSLANHRAFFYRNVLSDLTAASVVMGAPTADKVKLLYGFLDQITNIATEDALATQAIQDLLTNAGSAVGNPKASS